MCKIMIFTNFKQVPNNKETIEWIANKLLETERDGFGYSIMGKKGAYGEKYIAKNLKFETSIGINNKGDKFYSMPFIAKQRSSFGTPSKANGGAMFHGRISTNKAGLKNTHPINKHGWSLIHNGVVSNNGPSYEMITDNDTEHVVEHLAKGGIDSVASNLSGYYAAGAFDPSGNLHVIRDNIAWLYVAKLPEYETLLFATTSTLIQEYCEEFAIDRSTIELVKADSYMIFNPKGELTDFKHFKSLGYTRNEASYMSKSLSYMGDSIPFMEHYDKDVTDLDTKLSDYEAYRMELEKCMDITYTVTDWNGRKVSVEEFKKMDETSQDECTIVRSDGTLLTYEDYHTDRLANEYSASIKSDIY